jgi:hypothetical protein
MANSSGGKLFRKRNILGAALAAGIGLGIYLGQWNFGLGLGGNGFWGFGGPGKIRETDDTAAGDSSKEVLKAKDDSNSEIVGTPVANDLPDELPKTVPKVVRVLIDDRQYLLRGETKNTPISLANLIDLIKKAPGDDDGFRVRVYEKSNVRMSAEENLKAALAAAEIPESAIIFVPSAAAK